MVLDLVVRPPRGLSVTWPPYTCSGTARQTERRWGTYGVVINLRIRLCDGV